MFCTSECKCRRHLSHVKVLYVYRSVLTQMVIMFAKVKIRSAFLLRGT